MKLHSFPLCRPFFAAFSLSLIGVFSTPVAKASVLLFDPGTASGQQDVPDEVFQYGFGSMTINPSYSTNGLTLTPVTGTFASYTVGAYAIGGDFTSLTAIGEATGLSLENQFLVFSDFNLTVPSGVDLFVLKAALVFGSPSGWDASGGSFDLNINPLTGQTAAITNAQATSVTGVLTQIQFVFQPRNAIDDNLPFNSSGLSMSFTSVSAIPEPSTIALLGISAGIAGVIYARRRKLTLRK